MNASRPCHQQYSSLGDRALYAVTLSGSSAVIHAVYPCSVCAGNYVTHAHYRTLRCNWQHFWEASQYQQTWNMACTDAPDQCQCCDSKAAWPVCRAQEGCCRARAAHLRLGAVANTPPAQGGGKRGGWRGWQYPLVTLQASLGASWVAPVAALGWRLCAAFSAGLLGAPDPTRHAIISAQGGTST